MQESLRIPVLGDGPDTESAGGYKFTASSAATIEELCSRSPPLDIGTRRLAAVFGGLRLFRIRAEWLLYRYAVVGMILSLLNSTVAVFTVFAPHSTSSTLFEFADSGAGIEALTYQKRCIRACSN